MFNRIQSWTIQHEFRLLFLQSVSFLHRPVDWRKHKTLGLIKLKTKTVRCVTATVSILF